MNKVFIPFLLSVMLFSCGKSYYCDCTAVLPVHHTSFLLKDYSKEEAEAKCNEFSDTEDLKDCMLR